MMMQVAIRAFFPVWVWLYVMQFLLWPLIARDNWYASNWQSFLASMANTTLFSGCLHSSAILCTW